MASASLSGFSMTGWNANSFRPQLPLPPVTYPPYFGKCTFQYCLQSKILALAAMIKGIALFVGVVCCFLPYWFILKFNVYDSTFGSEGLRQLSADTGIFFYTDDNYISLLFLEKASNRMVVPGLFKVAQVCEVLSLAAVGCAFGGACILALRKYSSVTGVLFLAALGTIGALGQVLMVVFSMITMLASSNDICEPDPNCAYSDNLVWRNLPFWEQHRRLNQHTTPKIEANWGLYIACIGAAVSIGGCVLLWLEGLMVCKTVTGIRYQQLRTKRDLHEGERDPNDYIFSPPAARAGPPAMYGGPHTVAPRQTYRPPPSMSGSSMQSGSAYTGGYGDVSYGGGGGRGVGFVSREVDL